MIKGVNRRVVIMKNTGSDIFEGAFFLVKENKAKYGNTAVNEAKRLIAELEPESKKKRHLSGGVCFILGCALGLALSYFIL